MYRRRAGARHASSAGATLDAILYSLALALVLVLPFLWDSDCTEVFRVPKRELALVVWTALATVLLAVGTRKATWRDGWWWAWAGVLAGAGASALASDHAAVVLLHAVPLLLAALGWGALRLLSESRRERLATAVVVGGTVQAALTVLFVMPAFQPEVFARISGFRGRFTWIGTLGNPADVAVFLTLPALLAVAMGLKRQRRRWGYLTAAAIMLVTILATRTLSAAIAIACGGTLLLWWLVPRRARLGAVAGAVAVAAAATLVGPLAPRVKGAINEVRHGGWLSIGSGRGAGYAAAFGMLRAHPVTGVGFGMYENNSFNYQSEEILARRARVLRLKTAFGQTHNDALQHAAETGVLGVLLAAAGLFLAARHGRGTGVLPVRAPLLAAGTVLLLLQFPLHLAAIAAQWTVLAALALPALPAPPSPASRPLLRWAAVAVAVTAMGWVAWQRYVGSIAWQQASTLTTAIHEGQLGQGASAAARLALTRLEPRLVWFPGAWDALVVTGNVAMLAGRPDDALAYFSRALELAERPETRFNVGIALLTLGEEDAGYRHLMRAVKLSPWIYGEVTNRAVADGLRRRLDADGYGRRHPWIYKLSRIGD